MQIINYEAFVKDIEYRNEHNKCSKEYAQGARDTLEVAKLFIFERPAGHWIEHYDTEDGFTWLTCSRCMFKAYEEDYNFCPNCGAEMGKEAEND